jgi:hypothetical protein
VRVMWDVFDDCFERIGTLWIDGFVCGDCVMIKFRDNIFCCFRVCVCVRVRARRQSQTTKRVAMLENIGGKNTQRQRWISVCVWCVHVLANEKKQKIKFFVCV